MLIKGKLSLDDCKKAQWLHLRPRPLLKYIGIILLSLFTFIFIVSSYEAIFKGVLDRRILIFWACFAYIAFFCFFYPLRVKRLYRQHKLLKAPIDYEFRESGIKIKSPSVDANLGWDTFIKWKEGKKLFILYQNDALMNIVPKRFFNSEDDIIAFRQLLGSNIKKQLT